MVLRASWEGLKVVKVLWESLRENISGYTTPAFPIAYFYSVSIHLCLLLDQNYKVDCESDL